MTTDKQDTEFQDYIVRQHPTKALEPALEWIRTHLQPEDVFSQTELEKWAESEGLTKK